MHIKRGCIVNFFCVHRKKKVSSAVDRTTDNAESLATKGDNQGETDITVNGHPKGSVKKEEEEEEEGDRQVVNENQKFTGEQDKGESHTEDDTV